MVCKQRNNKIAEYLPVTEVPEFTIRKSKKLRWQHLNFPDKAAVCGSQRGAGIFVRGEDVLIM